MEAMMVVLKVELTINMMLKLMAITVASNMSVPATVFIASNQFQQW